MNDLGNKGYLVFGLILFVWELLPTTLLVGFFRVHRPPQDLVRLGKRPERMVASGGQVGEIRVCIRVTPRPQSSLSRQVFGSRSYFFDRAGHCEDQSSSWEHSRGESTR